VEQIELRGVTKSFSKGRERVVAVTNINMVIPKGSFVSITGASGSGKSTLLRLVGGLEKPTAGSIWINGTDIVKLNLLRRRRFLRETFATMHRSINVRGYRTAQDMVARALPRSVPKEERLRRAGEMLERVDLSNRAKHAPFNLSGGELRRVALARALVTGRPIVLAEEPTGQVDPVTARALLALIREINAGSGTTFIIVTDAEELAREATRTIRLEEGAIVYDHSRTFAPFNPRRG
jgi:ABC-type lipoprotein export system ATPase subunit